MKYEKDCRNCEHVCLASCKSCPSFGENALENFELRSELAKIENGTMIELPCKVGDIVFAVYTFKIYPVDVPLEGIVVGISWRRGGEKIDVSFKPHSWIEYSSKDVGKYIFFSKEAAEARLKELREQGE